MALARTLAGRVLVEIMEGRCVREVATELVLTVLAQDAANVDGELLVLVDVLRPGVRVVNGEGRYSAEWL
jgi:hypothetical protein